MTRFPAILLVFFLWAAAAHAAPPLSDMDRRRVADGATDRDTTLDGADSFYVLLRNAGKWDPADFSGEAGAATAPTPDYAYLAAHPAEVRGQVYLIEGLFVEAKRYPEGDQRLIRSGDPDWGDQVTRWAIRYTDNPDDVVLVYFNDPDATLAAPKPGSKVRVAGRFYKVWRTQDTAGRPFDFLTFVGGAHEVRGGASRLAFGGGASGSTIVIALIVICIAAFFVVRTMLNRKAAEGAGGRTQAYLEARRRDRERHGMDEDDDEQEQDLPEDPAAALDALSRKHEDA